MSEQTSEVANSYLRELDDALHGVDDAVRRDIVGGAREELQGLEPEEARQRIAALGDPVFVASEASESSPVTTARSVPAQGREGKDYAVTASVLVALGGILVPVLGWLAGLVMVWISSQWWRWEKVVASLVPIVVGALAFALIFLPPEENDRGAAVNPLIPAVFDIWWSGALLVMICNLIAGMWLLWRSRRTPRPFA
jgi:uncharacterized membrane protein